MQSNVTQQRVPIVGDPGPWVHVSESPRHVRVIFGGETIADSKRVKLVRESDVLPAYYFPRKTYAPIFSRRARRRVNARKRAKRPIGRFAAAARRPRTRLGVI